MRAPSRPALMALAALVSTPALATAVTIDYFVPSGPTPTIQSAVAAALLNPAALSRIFLVSSPIHTSSEVLIGAPFSPSRRVLIRPASTAGRVTVVGDAVSADIFHFSGAGQGGGATLQDLDIVREVTNNHHLIEVDYSFSDLVVERCRIGSTDSSPSGSGGWCYVRMTNPVNVTFRNCILFSVSPGTFDYGFEVVGFPDDVGLLRLYNNDVTDYGITGIHLVDHDPNGATLILRNNVVANSPAFPATSEPTAFHSEVDATTARVLSSGNACFASPGRVQLAVAPALSLLGADLDLFGRDALGDPADNTKAFRQRLWDIAQGYDANPQFFHLWPSGVLHDGVEDVGTTVGNGSPDPFDFAVTDDIDFDPRPSGAGSGHTDRGADQVEHGTEDVATRSDLGAALQTRTVDSPGPSFALRYRAGVSGTLRIEVFDLAGRRFVDESRAVSSGESGVMRRVVPPGLVLYRATLATGRSAVIVHGKAVVVR